MTLDRLALKVEVIGEGQGLALEMSIDSRL